MKTSKITSLGMTLITGVLMLAFQNCGRLNIDAKDLAATASKAGGAGTDILSDDIKVQISDGSGEVMHVVETIPVVDDDAKVIVVEVVTDQHVTQSQNNENAHENSSDQLPKTDDVIDDLNTDVVDEAQQPILVTDTALDEELEYMNLEKARTCQDFLKIKGATLIDLASFPAIDEILVVKGLTVIFSSNNNQYIENLKIDRKVGRTVVCGVKIGQISEVRGRLDLLNGAEVISVGSTSMKNIGSQLASNNRKK